MKEITVSPVEFDPNRLIDLVETAQELKSKITLSAGPLNADAASYLELLSLWADKQDETLKITIVGEDEQSGMEQLEMLFCSTLKLA